MRSPRKHVRPDTDLRRRWEPIARSLLPFGRGNVTRLGIAYFFSTLYFYIPVGTLYLRGRGLSYLQINSLWGIIVGTMFLTEIPTGVIADRVGRKRAINVALGLQLLGEVVFVFARNYASFALSAAIGGLGFAFGSGCVEALVYDALQAEGREAEMTKALGFVEAAQRLANLLAFSAGGLLAANLTQERFVIAVAITACAVGIGFLASFSLQEPRAGPQRADAPSSLDLLRAGVRLLRHSIPFRRTVLLSLATVPFADYLGSLYQPRFVAVGVPLVWFGLSRSLASGLGILGARYAHWMTSRLGRRMGLLVATVLPGLLYLAMATLVHPAFSVLVFCLLLGSMSLRGPIVGAELNRHIESGNRATVLSMISMASGIYVSLMGLLFGWIADRSVPAALVTMGAVVLVGSVLFRPIAPRPGGSPPPDE